MATIAVVGAGIVGVSCAWFLARDGHRVTLYDPGDPGTATSFGNAGILSFSHCLPVGHPDLLKRLPALVLGRDPFFRMRMRDLPRITPWLWRFLGASRPKAAHRIAAELVALVQRAEAAHREITAACRLEHLWLEGGWLKVGRDRSRFLKAVRAERAALDRFGLPYRILEDEALRELEPALDPKIKLALHLPEEGRVSDPYRYTLGIFRAFERRGGRFLRTRVRALVRGGGRIKAVVTESGEEMAADAVVVAAGVWSAGLLAPLGLAPPLVAERGYHAMLPHPDGPQLHRAVLALEEGFVLAPMKAGVRLTSGVELARVEAPPHYAWLRARVRRVGAVVPGLRPDIQSEWMGHRPSLPDSLPAIGWVAGVDGLLVAFGHHHLGLTLGPLTGRLIADLVAGRDPGLDLAPYRLPRSFL